MKPTRIGSAAARRNKSADRRRKRRMRSIEKGVEEAGRAMQKEGAEQIKRAERGLPRSAVPHPDAVGLEEERDETG